MNDPQNLETTRAMGDILIELLPAIQKPLGKLEILMMNWDQRSNPRRRCVTNSGTVVALALPRGMVLTDGMLILNNPSKSIMVKAEPQDLVVVVPRNIVEMCQVAHYLGKWHRTFQVLDDNTLLLEPESTVVNWLDAHGVKHATELRPYFPNVKGSAQE
jgi:urease accessory protein